MCPLEKHIKLTHIFRVEILLENKQVVYGEHETHMQETDKEGNK